ncbi:hypothetical protein [Echinicola sediminis]
MGFYATVNPDLIGVIGTFIALFSGILFSFTFLMFEASKKKKQELIGILNELGLTFKAFQEVQFLPENDKYNLSDIHNRLRYIKFADTLFTSIVLLVIISIFIFLGGISLGITIDYFVSYKYQGILHNLGLSFYSFFTCIYIWTVFILAVKVYRFYMFELKL